MVMVVVVVEVGFVLMVLVKPDGDGFLSVCLFVIVVVFDLKTASGNGQTLGSASCRGQWRTGKNGEKLVANSSVGPQRPSCLKDR